MNNRFKVLTTVFVMGSAYGLVYALPFVQYIFYDPFVEAIGATNAQLGTLIALFGIGNLLAPFGGMLADKFNYKKVYMISLVANALLCLLFAFNLNYSFALFTWGGLAITALFGLFPAHTKIVRFLGNENEQGKIFGLMESSLSIGGVITNVIVMALFAKATNPIIGFKYVVIGYGVIALLHAVILYFLIDDPKEEMARIKAENDAKEASEKLNVWTVLKTPGIWFAGFAVFSGYSTYVSLSYFTPYFTDVLGVSVVFAGSLAIARTYLVRIIGAPMGGAVGDRIGSVSKSLIIGLAVYLVFLLAIMNVPAGTSTGILIAFVLIVAFANFFARGSMWGVQEEVKIPRGYAGLGAGVICAIGFSPDLFQFTLFGNWLDKYGNAGYQYIFTFTLVVLALGIVNALLALRYKKKIHADESLESKKIAS